MTTAHAIVSITKQCKRDIVHGNIDFSTANFKVALYEDMTNIDFNTTDYTTQGELSSTGTNYTAGGNTMTISVADDPDNPNQDIIAADTHFNALTGAFDGAMVYNADTGKTVATVDFSNTTFTGQRNYRITVNGDFIIRFGSRPFIIIA